MTKSIYESAASVLDKARKRGIMIATAESCTGGLIAGALTEVPGSSDVVDRGFVTYSNEAKNQMLGVQSGTLATVGAVSEETASEMAKGAVSHSSAQLSVAVTGVAGPGGGSQEKPVGLVYIATHCEWAGTRAERCLFDADDENSRATIRQATVVRALQMLSEALDQAAPRAP